jgi:accessory colonization factor AcfC
MIVAFDLPDPPDTRDCNSPDDWDDILTIGKHLKKKGKSFYQLDINTDYAIYLGLNRIGIKDINYKIIKIIEYTSSEEMHKIWELD